MELVLKAYQTDQLDALKALRPILHEQFVVAGNKNIQLRNKFKTVAEQLHYNWTLSMT